MIQELSEVKPVAFPYYIDLRSSGTYESSLLVSDTNIV